MKGVESVHSYVGLLTLGAVGGFRLGDMAAQLFFFLLLLWLLKKFAWGPLMNTMQKREEYVASEIESAEKNRLQAEAASKQAAEQLNQVRQEAQKMIEDAKNAGLKQEQDIIEAARH